MTRRFIALLLGACIGWPLFAHAEVRPFVAGSLAQIQSVRHGKPFVLAFWSIGCTYCPSELKTLGGLKRRHPRLDIVLVATDSLETADQTAQLARSYGLGKVEQWAFADPMPERLRFEIDRRWYGELPRTHLYDRSHKVEAVSGIVPEERLQRWIRENL